MGILPQISEESKLIIFFPSNIFRANLTNWHWKYIYMAYEFKEAFRFNKKSTEIGTFA